VKLKHDIFVLLAVSLAVVLVAIVTAVDVGTVEKGTAMPFELNMPEFSLHVGLLIAGIWIGARYKHLQARLAASTEDAGAPDRGNRPPEGPSWNGGDPK